MAEKRDENRIRDGERLDWKEGEEGEQKEGKGGYRQKRREEV